MTATEVTKVDPVGLAAQLIDAGHADTVYRDVYLQRAWTLLGGVFSMEEFRHTEEAQAELVRLPLTIGRAMEKADWPRVKELSDRGQALRRTAEGRRREMEAARGVYAVTDVRLDPSLPVCSHSSGSPGRVCSHSEIERSRVSARWSRRMRRGRTTTASGGRRCRLSR